MMEHAEVSLMFPSYGRLYIPEEFEDPDDLTDLELTEGVTEFIEDILQKPEGIAEIDKTYGEGTASGLMDAIHQYKGFVIFEDDEEPSDETILEWSFHLLIERDLNLQLSMHHGRSDRQK